MSLPPPLTSSHSLAVVLGGAWYLDGADGDIARWAVDVVSAMVRSHTRLSITPTVGTLTLTGTPARRLVVGERPLTAVSSVIVDGTLLAGTDYRWTRGGALHRATGWGGPDRDVLVTCAYGFASVPPDLAAVVKTAATRLIANPAQWKTERTDEPEGARLRTSDAPTGFTVGELAVLNRYRRRTA